ncbi:hypothetical protein QTP88_011715 [Uroleucon formosanum]
MFGCKARVGLAPVGIPVNELCNLSMEEDIEKIMLQPENNEDNEIRDENSENNEIGDEKCLVNKRQENITNERSNSIQCLKKQAERMTTNQIKNIKSWKSEQLFVFAYLTLTEPVDPNAIY